MRRIDVGIYEGEADEEMANVNLEELMRIWQYDTILGY